MPTVWGRGLKIACCLGAVALQCAAHLTDPSQLPPCGRFGTRRFLPARELPPAEQRQQLGAAESDLLEEDCECGVPQ